MATACPACGRPNRDGADKCLYCVAPLAFPSVDPARSAVAPARSPSLSSSTPLASELGGSESDRYLLILLPGPGEAPDTDSVRGLARIASVSVYDARLALSARRPRMFRRLSSESEARSLSRELTEARLAHYVVSEASVVGLPVSKASSGELSDRHVKWRLEGGATRYSMPLSEILLLVSGEITRERHHEKRLASTRSATRRLTSGLRLHLYERDAQVAVEIDPESFDFAMLGSARTTSAHLNFQKLVAQLAERAPGMGVDRGFSLQPVVVTRTSGAGDVTDALAQEKGPEGVLYDNEAAFRFYARWRYRVERHLSRRISTASSPPSG